MKCVSNMFCRIDVLNASYLLHFGYFSNEGKLTVYISGNGGIILCKAINEEASFDNTFSKMPLNFNLGLDLR